VYLVGGFIIAYLIYTILGLILHTPMPIVAILTNSMIPTLYPGDAVVLYGTDDIKVGDIIVFDAGRKGCIDETGRLLSQPIIHRVIKINPDGTLETKGDNNPWQIPGCEQNIPREYVYGKVILKIPLVGWPRKILMDLLGI
jgi:signal peptidase